MEYEQLENGKKILEQAIMHQDVGNFHDILAKDVVLVTHFSYPDSAEKNFTTALDISPVSASTHQQQLKRRLLKEQAEELERQQERYHKSVMSTEKNRSGYDDANHHASDKAEATSPTAARADAAVAATQPRPAPATQQAAQTTTTTAAGRKQKAATSGSTRTASRSTAKAGGAPSLTSSISRENKLLSYFMQIDSPSGVTTSSDTAAKSSHGGEDDYGERVDLVQGRRMVTQRLGLILMWLNHKKYISDVQVQLEVRKGILQNSEVLPPPPTPQNMRERYLLVGRQLTNRNQMLSRLTVVWGGEYLLFRDQYYFDDGVVVSIQRRMLGMDEMLERPMPATLGDRMMHLSTAQRVERFKQEVLSFYGASASSTTVTMSTTVLPMLDYSFVSTVAAIDLLRVQPITGKVHTTRGLRPVPDPHLMRGVFLNESNDPSLKRDSTRVLIKARNKRGDEEAYEFDMDRERFALMLGNDRNSKGSNSMEALIAERDGLKYDANSVRISGCKLSEQMDKFVPVLRALVANALVTVHSLDLSNNAISKLPDFTVLPLQKLQLHSNKISDWQEVEKNVSPLPYLTSFTLHGNPLSESNENYWNRILTMLLNHPARRAKLRQLDFVTLTAQDYNVAAAYTTFTTGDRTARARMNGMLARKDKTTAPI